jgi:hypothetical protein
MRDHLAHRYFDTAHSILHATVDDDLPELERAIHALAQTLVRRKLLLVTGAVCFPAIEPPDPTWLARSVLYWETVAVLLPDAGTLEIEQFLRRSGGLLHTGLVVRALPGDTHIDFVLAFAAYLEQLEPAELERRRARFRAGQATRLYPEQFLWRVLPQQADDLGLADMHPASEVVAVETTTAREWMSAVTLGLCHPRSGWSRETTGGGKIEKWVPVTGTAESFLALSEASATRMADRPAQMRIGGSLTRAEPRVTALRGILPVPRSPNAGEVASFRDKYGDVLINMREDLERRADGALRTQDGELSHAAAAQLVEDFHPQIYQAERVLRTAGWDSLTAMTLAVATKVAVGDAETASSHIPTSPGYETEPLAYVLINGSGWPARREDGDRRRTGPPLASIIEDRLAMERGYELDDWEYDDDGLLDEELPEDGK